MVREQKNNYAALSGEVIQEPIYSHSAGGEDYFTFPLRCLRLSGAEDLLNLVLSRTQLEQLDGRPGDRVGVIGQVRSYNNHSGQGSKLVITVRVQALFPAPAQEDSNQVRLVGNLCRKPVYRRTPLGREIADLLLAVNRGCGKADYLPCIAWGGLARRCGAGSPLGRTGGSPPASNRRCPGPAGCAAPPAACTAPPPAGAGFRVLRRRGAAPWRRG